MLGVAMISVIAISATRNPAKENQIQMLAHRLPVLVEGVMPAGAI